MSRGALSVAVFALFLTGTTNAALVLSQTDGAVPRVYANGAGTGFGGTLGNGSILMDVVGSNLVISLTPGSSLNDIVGLYLDTKAGGYVDADMRDRADGGRTVLSELTLTKDDAFPTGFQADYGLAIGSFGTALFELNAGSTDGHLNFLQFNPALSISIPLATIGNPAVIDFFAGYASGGGYNSNESLPYSKPLNGDGNPGFGDGQFGGLNTGGVYENFNRFIVTPVPEPGTILVWGLVLATIGFVVKRLG